jgi:hypothetical protein
MDEIDGIWNCNGLKYGTYKNFDTFWLINIDGDQNIGQKKTPLKTRSFLSLVVHLKNLDPLVILVTLDVPKKGLQNLFNVQRPWTNMEKDTKLVYKGFSHTCLHYHIKITIPILPSTNTLQTFYPIFFTQREIPMNYI